MHSSRTEALQPEQQTGRNRSFSSQGHSNQQIAEMLFITKYTVKDHLKEIFQKIGVPKPLRTLSQILEWR